MDTAVKYLNIKGVCSFTTLSRSVIYRLMDETDFPKSFSINGVEKRVVWTENEVADWFSKNVVKKAI